MSQVKLAEDAEADLVEIWIFIAQDSVEAADHFLDRAYNTCQALARSPGIGRDRSDLVRVPAYKPGYESSVRIEYRAPDPACNPYLAFSVMLAAGLKGIEEEYPVPPPVEGNVFAMSQEEIQAKGIKTLPGSLGEALLLAENSDLLREALGEHIFNSFLRNKRIEWNDYRATVTDYEISHYLPNL